MVLRKVSTTWQATTVAKGWHSLRLTDAPPHACCHCRPLHTPTTARAQSVEPLGHLPHAMLHSSS
jgi:hypothetical protein